MVEKKLSAEEEEEERIRQLEERLVPWTATEKIFKKLKGSQPANQKCFDCGASAPTWASIPFGIFICLTCAGKQREWGVHITFVKSITLDQNWKSRELRKMKVGGNESAKKFFQAQGGSALLRNTDIKSKYESRVAVMYKGVMNTRYKEDLTQFPEDIVLTGLDEVDGTSTPAGDPKDDFFDSWDKPTVKRPTPPVSRTATPPVVGRTPSPFLSANATAKNGNGISRTASPLAGADGSAPAAPTSSRTTSSAALRKATAAGAGPRKANVLGAKKTKLGAKKVAGDAIDFDAAERKAKEEAERIAKLGYDPDAEELIAKKSVSSAKSTDSPKIASPTPVSPGRAGFGSTQRSNSDVERLGIGMGRLGFGQIGGNKAAAAPKKMGGFGSVGPSLSAKEADEEKYARQKFGTQKGISSDEFFGKGAFDPSAQSEAKTRLQGFEGASAISSNAYFGRPEEEAGGDDYGDLETTARNLVRDWGNTAGDDLDTLTALVGDGASKLQGAIQSYLRG